MSKNFSLSIVGATGLVGQTIIKVLQEYNLQPDKIVLFASERSEGKTVEFFGKQISVLTLTAANIKANPTDFAIFSAGSSIAKIFAKVFVKNGTTVIDNSSAFRRIKRIPLVVPEINFNDIKPDSKLISNPNCSTIQSVIAIEPVIKKYGCEFIHYSTMQSVSGSGQKGIIDLENTTNGLTPKFYPHPIYNNCIPQIDKFTKTGNTGEEEKMIHETKKILKIDAQITATCTRVPVQFCHSVDILLKTKKPFKLSAVKQLLKSKNYIKFLDMDTIPLYPINSLAKDNDFVWIGRVRKVKNSNKLLQLYCVSDNIRKGAASNAVQILQKLLDNNLN